MKRRHHVVPRFYLRLFADSNDALTRVPFGGGRPHPIGARDATVQTDFYSLAGTAERADAFEDALGAVEDAAAPVVRKILGGAWPLGEDDRMVIAGWTALQYLRSEATRVSGADLTRAISKLQVGVSTTDQLKTDLDLPEDSSPEEVERIRANMLAEADTRPIDHFQHLRLIAESLDGMTRLIYFRRPWVLTRWSRKTLGTSDTPVILVPDRNFPGGAPARGLGVAPEVLLPLARRAALTFGQLGGEDRDFAIPGNALLANRLNRYTFINARREAFHHPADEPFAGLEVPAPRTIEMDARDGEIEELIRAFAAQQGRDHGLPE